MDEHVYEPPTEEQLVRFVTVMVHGAGYTDGDLEMTRAMLELPELHEGWLERHREMQVAAWNM